MQQPVFTKEELSVLLKLVWPEAPAGSKTLSRLQDGLSKLPVTTQAIIHLYHVHSLPAKLIAEQLLLSTSQVRTRLSQARHLLRKSVDEKYAVHLKAIVTRQLK